MRFYVIVFVSILVTGSASAQVPEDALRLSWLNQNGTARNQAVGGAMGSLGGDITATFVNPAGIGLYKTGELVLSPGISFLNNKSNYRGTSAAEKNSSFLFGTSGVVLGFANPRGNLKSGAFSFAVNRTANFNSNVYYTGENDFSSYSEQYALELSNSKIPIGRALEYSSGLSLGTKMAVYTYLIDTSSKRNGTTEVIGLPELIAARTQEHNIVTTGGVTEIAMALAGNMNDKVYFGGSVGLPIVNYTRTTTFTERDATGNNNNNFEYSTLTERFSTKGVGLNAKIGVILKPVENIRLGLALHTPTLYGLQDTYSGDMTTETENYPPSPGLVKVSDATVSGNQITQFKYDLVSPWKVMLSGSYIFREVEDVKKQRGFISADIEYINHQASSYASAEESSGDNAYYRDINNTIDDEYKGTFNFRAGGELKFNTIMARAGFSYYGNPYEDSELKASRMFVSGGLGYRDKGFFLDLTYVYAVNKDVSFPYRLSDKPNTFAELKGIGGNVLLTAGFKF